MPEGETGVLLFTHLQRRGTAFLRYRIGDVVSMSTEPCAHCGRTTPRITSQPVRSGDIVKIKGTLVNLQALKDLLERAPEIDEYQIIIWPQDAADQLSQDELVLRIAAAAGALASPDALAEEVTRLAHVRLRIEHAGRD